jgi:hypothetical protein
LQYVFDENLSVTHIFIKQIFRAVELAPPHPSPSQGFAVRRGWGSSGFGYGYEAVRIRVKK